jgi:hypothetical protein
MATGPLLIGLSGTRLDDQDREQLAHPAVGGVVLFTRACWSASTRKAEGFSGSPTRDSRDCRRWVFWGRLAVPIRKKPWIWPIVTVV